MHGGCSMLYINTSIFEYLFILSEELGLNGEPYIQSHKFFCIRSAGQPQIGPHFIWNRDK